MVGVGMTGSGFVEYPFSVLVITRFNQTVVCMAHWPWRNVRWNEVPFCNNVYLDIWIMHHPVHGVPINVRVNPQDKKLLRGRVAGFT